MLPRQSDEHREAAVRVAREAYEHGEQWPQIIDAALPHLRKEWEAERLDAIEEALAILGSGKCSANQCESCAYEVRAAIAVLRAALSGVGP